MLTDVRSGYINVQSATGMPLARLEETRAFRPYDFGWEPEPWWIPAQDFQQIMQANFPGCDLHSRQAIAACVPRYSSPKAFFNAVTNTGSMFHIYKDGPLTVTMTTSVTAGAVKLCHEMDERRLKGRERGYLICWNEK